MTRSVLPSPHRVCCCRPASRGTRYLVLEQSHTPCQEPGARSLHQCHSISTPFVLVLAGWSASPPDSAVPAPLQPLPWHPLSHSQYHQIEDLSSSQAFRLGTTPGAKCSLPGTVATHASNTCSPGP